MTKKIYYPFLFNLESFFLSSLLLTSFLARVRFLSKWLEDWDSVQFALGLHNFSIINHQPHPPGYPIYILMGKFFLLLTQNDTLALTLMSAFFGSLAILPLYFLAKIMFDQRTAFLACLFFTVMPISWALSEVALTNIPGLFFLLTFIYFLYKFKDNFKKLILVSFFGGFILGIRFTELPIIVVLLSLVLIKNFNPKRFLIASVFFLLGIALWVIPTATLTGFDKFLQSYAWIANYVIKHDAQVDKRLENIWYLLQVGYTSYFTILSLVLVLISLIKKNLIKQFKFQFLGAWFLAYAIPLIFIYNLEVPRYTLPLLPPLVILSSYFFIYFTKKYMFLIILLLLILTSLFRQSLSQVSRFYFTVPPTIAATKFVKANFDPENSVIIATFTFRQFQYYTPQFLTFYGEGASSEYLTNKTIIIDYVGLKDQIKGLEKFEIVEARNFAGDKDIFTRIPSVNIYILKPIPITK